jgi:DNA-binding GntR family transcriptional regulator
LNTLAEKVKGLNFKATGLEESISEILSRTILQGFLKGGDQLVEVNLQERFGISRSLSGKLSGTLRKRG